MPKDLDGGNGTLPRVRPRTLNFLPLMLLFPFSACDMRESGDPAPDDVEPGEEAGEPLNIDLTVDGGDGAAPADGPGDETGHEAAGDGTSGGDGAASEMSELRVTATAYNSLPEQTHPDHPTVTAWGDDLEPGMRVVAVSRDLEELGIGRGTELEIEGMDSTWVVRDRMHRRWSNRIDLYMGKDVEAAREWGKREVTIRWREDP